MKNTYISAGAITLSLMLMFFLLPGCGKEEEKKSQPVEYAPTVEPAKTQESQALASINGKPLVTEQEYEDFLTNFDQAQPGAKMFIKQDPQMEEQFITSLVDQKLIRDYWIKDEGYDATPEYQKTLKQFQDMCAIEVANQKFQEVILKDLEVPDSEVKKFYNENKQQFVKTPGGVKAQEVVFDDEKAASDFLNKAKAQGANFGELAQKSGKEIKHLGDVTRENMIVPPIIKNKLLKITKVPSVDLITVGKEYHVVNSTEKIEEEYQKFDEAKDLARQMITYEKYPKVLADKKQELRDRYKIKMNDDYFKKREAEMEDETDIMNEEEDNSERKIETIPLSA